MPTPMGPRHASRPIPKISHTTTTLDLIGNTPSVLLQGPSGAADCEIWGKCEFTNPGASVKDRAALSIIRDAEESGALKPGGTVVEGNASNSGISRALLCPSAPAATRPAPAR